MSKTMFEISEIYKTSERSVQRKLANSQPIDNVRPYKYSKETIEAIFGLPPVPDWQEPLQNVKRVTKSMFTAIIAENKELKTELAMFKTRLERLESMFNSLQPTTIPDSDGWD